MRLKNMPARKRRALIAAVLVCIVFGGFFLFYNIKTRDYADDFGYRYVFSRDVKLTDDRVDSLGEVFSSQYEHYFLMNGRTVPHFILQTLLMAERWLFDILSPIVYVLLALGMYVLARCRSGASVIKDSAPSRGGMPSRGGDMMSSGGDDLSAPLPDLSAQTDLSAPSETGMPYATEQRAPLRGRRQRPLLLLVMFLLPWVLFPDFGNVFLIPCVSVNYMWAMCIIVWTAVPFARLLCGYDRFAKHPAAGAALMAFAGLCAGWCSENGSAALLFGVGCMGLYYLIAKKKIPAWCWTGFGGALCGFVLMLCAPGYGIRTEAEQGKMGVFARFERLVSAHLMLPYGALIFTALAALAVVLFLQHTQDVAAQKRFAAGAGALSVIAIAVNWIFYYEMFSAWTLLVLCAAAAVVCAVLYSKVRRETFALQPLALPVGLMASGLVSILALIAVPYVQVRSQLPFLVLFGTGAVMVVRLALRRLGATFWWDKAKASRVGLAAAAIAVVYSLVSLVSVAVLASRNCDNYLFAEEDIARQKAEGAQTVVMLPLPEPTDRRVAWVDMTNNDPEYWINQAFCRYYGVEGVHWAAGDETVAGASLPAVSAADISAADVE